MAYAALVSLDQTIQNIIHHEHKYPVFLRERQRIRSLHERVVFLQSFLEEFTDELAYNLEGRIRDKANEAEDIVEYLILEQIRPFHSHQARTWLGNVMHARHQYDTTKLHVKLQNVICTIDSMVVGEVRSIKNSLISRDMELISDSPIASSLSRQARAPTDKGSVVGFGEDLIAIKRRLCGESSKLQVIPILGMGGIGKTTLARNAYDDPLIMEHFDIRAWVTVSQDFNVKRIFYELLVSIEALDEERFDHRNETMDVRVYKSLKGRRYLVVMDDMWSTDVWDGVRRLFPDDNSGSRIMLTTRLADVAAYADRSSPIHEMQFMNVDQSWDLLRHKLYKDGNCPHELEDVGWLIARSCRGLPLAIVVIAGILSTVSPTRASWETVAENAFLTISTNEEQFANILSLSYTHLPHHLRSCFLYMGGFPEDYEINVPKLIKLWTAEGFIKLSGSKSYEESAEEYLEDLVKRSLVLVTKRTSNEKLKSCSVHDMIRDLCIRKAQEKFLGSNLLRHVDKTPVYNQRRVTIRNPILRSELGYYDCTIRTVLWFPLFVGTLHGLKEFRLLRVLDVVDVELISKKFPSEVLELIFLRYLAFSFMHEIEFEIPASITRLRNLETLIICPYTNKYGRIGFRVRFSLEIWRMTQLRHLVLVTLDTIPDPCSGYPTLDNLQTLAQLWNFKFTEGIWQMIPNIKKLGIIYEGDGIEWREYRLDNLVHLHRLERLNIRVEDRRWDPHPCPLVGKLGFPKMLKKLKLRGFLLRSQDMEIIGSLPNLEVLKFRDCSYEHCRWETNEGDFGQLKFLQIIRTNLKQWIIESSHFPGLKRLTLGICRRLDEIPDVIGEISTLELIEVYIGDKSLVESAQRIKEEQESYGNESLQVRIMKSY